MVNAALGLKGARVTTLVNVAPTRPRVESVASRRGNTRRRPAVLPVEQVPPSALTALPALPIYAERPFLVPQKVEVDVPEMPFVIMNWSPAMIAFGPRTTWMVRLTG